MSALPLLAGHAPGAMFAADDAGRCSVEAFVVAAGALAQALPPADSALLLCEDRVRFALGFAALLLRGTTALLPPSHAPRALAGIVQARRPGFALSDRVGVAAGVREIAVERPRPAAAPGPVPAIDGEHVAAIVYTSGTTGDPQPHAKRWGSLVAGAQGLRERSGFRPGDAIVGAVPPQHMWGLEATVMLALQGGGAIHGATPLLPHDIADALAAVPAPRWLVLTPLHARSVLIARVALPPLAGTLSATSPLDADTALAYERLTGAAATEIYGSSETGVIATRRPARDVRFTPLPGVVIASRPAGLSVRGAHVGDGIELRDRARVDADGRFALLGRDADLVKVGGKRASLAMLNATLRAIPGVVDAEYVVTERGGLSPRVAALVVAPSLDRDAVVAALRERIDPVFLPRPLHLVAALPRNAVGKIAKDALATSIDALDAGDGGAR